MNPSKKLILITGANGFLGRELCRFFDAQGYRVRALVRDLKNRNFLIQYAKGGIYHCELPDKIDYQAFTGKAEALIHCAYSMQTMDKKAAEEINIHGSQQLIRLARAHSIRRFVFISSLSAHNQAESYYGRSKLRIEHQLDAKRDLIIRPGLIIGNGGLFERMQNSLKQLSLVPLFYGGKQEIQTIHVSELCEAIERSIDKGLVGLFKVAANEPIQIRTFYENLAASIGKKCHFVHLPGAVSLRTLRFLEKRGFNLPINSENLLGLKQMKAFDTSADLAQLGIDPTSWDSDLKLKLRQ